MKELRIFAIILIVFILQLTICPAFRLGNVDPNLILIVVALLGIHLGFWRGAFLGAGIGVVVDVLSGVVIGPYVLTFLVCGALAGTVAQKMYKQHWLTAMSITMGATCIEGIIIGLWSGHGEFLTLVISILLPGILYNGIVSIPVSQIIFYYLKPVLPQKTVLEIF